MLPQHFIRDALLADLAYLFSGCCVLCMGLFLQTGLSNKNIPRTVFGLLITGLLLLVQPSIYNTPTQTYGIGIASSCCLVAWTLLHWTFMEPLNKRPTLLQVCCSVVTHPMSGVIKVYKRMQRHHAKAAPTPHGQEADSGGKVEGTGMQLRSSGRPLVVVDACGDVQLVHTHTARDPLSAVVGALTTMLGVAIAYDAGLYFLCAFSRGMCVPGSTAGPSSPLAIWLFAYAAGSLLPLQMDVMYCFLRATLFAGALVWPALGDYARQLPPHAFNRPGLSRSIGELWAARWHQFLRHYFSGMGYSSMDKLLLAFNPDPKAVSPAMRSSLHTVSAFLMSAVMHEYLTWAAFNTVTGMYAAYFGLHCAAVLLEGWGPLILKASIQLVLGHNRQAPSHGSQDGTTVGTTPPPARRASRATAGRKPAHGHILALWAQHVWATAVIVLLAPLFVEPYRAGGYFAQRAWHPAGVSVTRCVVEWAQQHLHAPLGFAGLPGYLLSMA